jgi:titin
MNLTNPVRRAVAVVALAASIAGAAGVAQAGATAPPEPVPTEAPSPPTAEESPPGDDAGSTASPPVVADDGTTAPTTTTPPASTEPVAAPEATQPPVAPPTVPPVDAPSTTTPPTRTPVTTTPSVVATPPTTAPVDAIATVVAAQAATAPQSLMATPGNKSVKLTWKAPANNGGAPILEYAVQRYTANGWVNVASPTGLSYTVGSLTNGTKYSFRVRAHNAAGWSAPSNGVTAIPRTVPSAPTGLVATPGNKSVKLTWKAPANNGGAPILDYAVQRYTANGWVNVASPTGLSYTVGSLTNGTNYSFRVRAHNAAGWGPVSAVVSTVPYTVPSAPSKCTADQWGHDGHTLLVQWWASPSDGGSPAWYTLVRVRKAAGFDGVGYGPWLYSHVAGPGPEVDAFAHVPFGWYEVSVQAVNAAGPGPACTTGVLLWY